MQAGTVPAISSNDTRNTGDALMGRLFYSFDKKIYAYSIRQTDGYSAFGVSNPHATFPSVALGWVFSEEPFFKFPAMDFGKLRVSWGQNGNRDIGMYAALAENENGRVHLSDPEW